MQCHDRAREGRKRPDKGRWGLNRGVDARPLRSWRVVAAMALAAAWPEGRDPFRLTTALRVREQRKVGLVDGL